MDDYGYFGSNEPKYCACLYANNVLYMYNCIHEKAIKPSCILYLGKIPFCAQLIRTKNVLSIGTYTHGVGGKADGGCQVGGKG